MLVITNLSSADAQASSCEYAYLHIHITFDMLSVLSIVGQRIWELQLPELIPLVCVLVDPIPTTVVLRRAGRRTARSQRQPCARADCGRAARRAEGGPGLGYPGIRAAGRGRTQAGPPGAIGRFRPQTQTSPRFRPGAGLFFGTGQSANTPPVAANPPRACAMWRGGGARSNWPFQAARGRSPGWLLHRNEPVQNRDASTMRCASPPTADRRPPAP